MDVGNRLNTVLCNLKCPALSFLVQLLRLETKQASNHLEVISNAVVNLLQQHFFLVDDGVKRFFTSV